MKRRLVVLVLLSALLTGMFSPAVAGQVSAAPQHSHAAVMHTQSHAAAFDKTRFVAHLAVSAFLIHYIYKKYKEHKLGRFHIFTDLKAAAAALIAYHELKVAYGIAKTSKSKTLQALVAPIAALGNATSTLASKVKSGNTSEIPAANSLTSLLSSTASKNGFGFKDQQPSGFSGF
jgi:hypothetical protein